MFNATVPQHQVLLNLAAYQDDEEEEVDENSVEGLRIAEEVSDGTARVLCARCYSLTHYGCARACLRREHTSLSAARALAIFHFPVN